MDSTFVNILAGNRWHTDKNVLFLGVDGWGTGYRDRSRVKGTIMESWLRSDSLEAVQARLYVRGQGGYSLLTSEQGRSEREVGWLTENNHYST